MKPCFSSKTFLCRGGRINFIDPESGGGQINGEVYTTNQKLGNNLKSVFNYP